MNNIQEIIKENDLGIIERDLKDTQYMEKIAIEYLSHICKNNTSNYDKNVKGIPGQMTSILREVWGLNFLKNKPKEVWDGLSAEEKILEKEKKDKYRANHIHHAIDAFVVACSSQAQLQKLAKIANKTEIETNGTYETRVKHLTNEITPFEKFNMTRSKFMKMLETTLISYKQNVKNPLRDRTSTVGQLHKDTAYGKIVNFQEGTLKARFTNTLDNKEWTDITTYIPIFEKTEQGKIDKEAYYIAFETWFASENKSRYMNARTKDEKLKKQEQKELEARNIKALQTAAMKAYKWYVGGNNFAAEIYQIHPNNKIRGVTDKQAGNFASEIISNYEAHRRGRKGYLGLWHKRYPNAKRIMTLKRNDIVQGTFTKDDIDNLPKGIKTPVSNALRFNDEVKVLFRVKKLSSKGEITLRQLNISKEEADTKSWISSASSLQKYKAMKVQINAIGKITTIKDKKYETDN